MSITFGSVGDIIAVGQIAWSLAKALADSRGSAKEYQGLIKELQTFDQALLQIVALWQNYENSPELDKLGMITKNAVKDWRDTLVEFRVKVDKKYGMSLGAGGSGNWIKDAGKKVIWLKEKEDILGLRRKLGSASDTITMLTLAAMGTSNKLAESTMECRVQAVHCLLQESNKLAEEQVVQLKKMDQKIELQSKKSDLILNNVKSGAFVLTQIYSMTIDIKNLLGLFQSHMRLQQSTPRGLGTGWQQDPLILEDALGFQIPIPLELVTSWKMLDLILQERFENRPGRQKVLNHEFAIEDGVTGRDFNRENEFTMCFHPGQKIDMSMVFSDGNLGDNSCPRCGTKSEATTEVRTQCISCKMWFQRVVEIEESESESESESEPEPIPRSTGPELSQAFSKNKVKKTKTHVSTPADFQRVRLMSTLSAKEQRHELEQILQGLESVPDPADTPAAYPPDSTITQPSKEFNTSKTHNYDDSTNGSDADEESSFESGRESTDDDSDDSFKHDNSIPPKGSFKSTSEYQTVDPIQISANHDDRDRHVTLRRLTEEEAAAEQEARRNRRQRADSMSGTDTDDVWRRYRRLNRREKGETDDVEAQESVEAGAKADRKSGFGDSPSRTSSFELPPLPLPKPEIYPRVIEVSPESHGTWSDLIPSPPHSDIEQERRPRRGPGPGRGRGQRPTPKHLQNLFGFAQGHRRR